MKYADDCFLFSSIMATNQTTMFCASITVSCLVSSWCREVGFVINYQKCKSRVIKSRQQCRFELLPDIKIVKSLKLFGVTFQENLSWTVHFDNVVLSSSRRLEALRVSGPFLSCDELKIVYFSLVRSILEYSNPLFLALSTTDQRRLEHLQGCFRRPVWLCMQRGLPSKLAEWLFWAAASPNTALFRLVPREVEDSFFLASVLFCSRKLLWISAPSYSLVNANGLLIALVFNAANVFHFQFSNIGILFFFFRHR